MHRMDCGRCKIALPMPIGNGSIQRELFSFALKQERTMHSHGPLLFKRAGKI